MHRLAEDIAAAEAVLADAPTEPEARAAFLYRHWFHAAPLGGDASALAHWPTRAEFVAAALPVVPLESGWRVAGPGGEGRVRIVREGGQEMEASLLDIVLSDPLAPPAPGAALQRRRWIERDVGGFWHLWSEQWALGAPEAVLRLYLPIDPAAMLAAAAQLVAGLPPDAMWAMKFLSGPHIPGRHDAGVIYLSKDGWASALAAPLLTGLAPVLTGPRLRLTRPWQGVFVADDPGDGRSFGEAVSQELAGLAPGSGFAARARQALSPLLGHLEA